ncbi:hypothetical protein DXG01_002188 [Tephrocybe rancida]|nr:hypothetical protein DXG01_002188 [Tephrocybe rancida]
MGIPHGSCTPGDAVFDTLELDEAYITQLDRQFLLNCVMGDDDFGVADGELPDMVEDEQIESDNPEIMSPPNTLPGSLADLDVEQPRTDALNNTYVRIVHNNGMHHIPVLRCGCHGEASVPADLVAAGLIPTSFKRFRTFFTTSVLDNFQLTNLECKASTYQYWNKLSRTGAPGISHQDLDDFYRELRRLSRSWRWVKKLIWSGFAHDSQRDIESLSPSKLALFCSTCPQDKLNLPDNWKDDPNKDLYMRSIVADSNSKAYHVRQNPPGWNKSVWATGTPLPDTSSTDTLGSPSPDKWLGEGGQFMTTRPPYIKYLNEKQNLKPTKAPCENQFRVLEQSMLLLKACNVKGIVALACARHGCFIPTCVVDLPVGEQQKNIDYLLRELFRHGNMDEVQQLPFMYDIVCQNIIHLAEHLGPDLPQNITIDQAIGLMHVHRHKDDCYQRFASTCIPSTAITAGEILETLWASLNKVSSQARTATLAHRAEILDDHMSNNNWKKIINMPLFLCQKFWEAIDMKEKAEKYHGDMVATLNPTEKEEWDKEIGKTEVDCIQDYKAMDLMKTRDVAHPTAIDTQDAAIAEGQDANEEWMWLVLMIEEEQ